MPTTSKNSVDTADPIAADIVKCLQPAARGRGRRGNDNRSQDNDRGMPERKVEASRERSLAFLHQLADDVVDRGNMICIESMPEAEHVGEDSGPEQSWLSPESGPRPNPARDVRRQKQGIDHRNFGL